MRSATRRLATGLALAAWVLAPVLAAQAVRVTIDVKPGDTPTTLEPDRGGLVPVAILTTPEFDATTIDPTTIHVGSTGTEASPFRTMIDDVNKDERADLVSLIRVQDMKLRCSDTLVKLTARTSSGTNVEGSEAVSMQGC